MRKITTGGGKNRLVLPPSQRLLRLITMCVSLNSILGAESSVQSLRVKSHFVFSSSHCGLVWQRGAVQSFKTQVAFTRKGLGIFVLINKCSVFDLLAAETLKYLTGHFLS